MIDTRTEKGWVVVGLITDEKPMIFDSVFSQFRAEAVGNFVRRFSPHALSMSYSNAWRKSYQYGYRCVRATRTITIETED